MRILQSTGNILIGSTTDSGQRLQVTGDTLLKGSGNDASTFALTVLSSGATLLRVRNDQKLLIGGASTTAAPVIYAFSGIVGDRSLRIGIQSAGSLTPTPAFNINQENDYTYTSGTGEFTTITANFLTTSGTGTLASLVLRNTINQTGGANGITRGLYIQPTLTSAADWRSIEWSNNTGWGLYGAGTATNYLNAALWIGTTSGGGSSIAIAKAINTNNASAIITDFQVQSGVTNVYGFRSRMFAGAGTYSVTNAYHFSADVTTNGATSTFTNQYGFIAQDTMIGATNNYGFYGNIAAATGRWNLYMNGTAANYFNGNTLIGSTTDSGEKLQVTGNVKIVGASSFGGNMTLSLNQNNVTQMIVSNTNSGTGAASEINFRSASNYYSSVGRYGTGTTAYKIIASNDQYIYNATIGDIAILNDATTGNIKFAAGGSSTAQLTIASTGKVLYAAATTAKAQINLASGTAPTTPVDGDIWFDGTDLKMRIGGVTKTFTLV
jgi:hypothetical protein